MQFKEVMIIQCNSTPTNSTTSKVAVVPIYHRSISISVQACTLIFVLNWFMLSLISLLRSCTSNTSNWELDFNSSIIDPNLSSSLEASLVTLCEDMLNIGRGLFAQHAHCLVLLVCWCHITTTTRQQDAIVVSYTNGK